MFAKKIADILLKDNSVIVERKLGLTRSGLENRILGLKYSGAGLLKDPNVENAELPPFIFSFYYYVFSKLTIPSEQEFVEAYYEINDCKIEDDLVLIGDKQFSKAGVDARLLRTYPSLVRDIHFYLLLSERNLFDSVCYSLRADYYDGLDLKIRFREREYFLSLYISTERGEFFKLKKTNRHDYSGIREIVLDVSFLSLEKHGDFYLLGEKHLEELILGLYHYDNGQ